MRAEVRRRSRAGSAGDLDHLVDNAVSGEVGRTRCPQQAASRLRGGAAVTMALAPSRPAGRARRAGRPGRGAAGSRASAARPAPGPSRSETVGTGRVVKSARQWAISPARPSSSARADSRRPACRSRRPPATVARRPGGRRVWPGAGRRGRRPVAVLGDEHARIAADAGQGQDQSRLVQRCTSVAARRIRSAAPGRSARGCAGQIPMPVRPRSWRGLAGARCAAGGDRGEHAVQKGGELAGREWRRSARGRAGSRPSGALGESRPGRAWQARRLRKPMSAPGSAG